MTRASLAWKHISVILVANYFFAAASASLVAAVFASPVAARQDASPFVYTNSNDLNFTQMNNTLIKVTVFATGNA